MTNVTSLKLTECQSLAIQKIKEFISLDCHNRLFRLTGYAGTGKSFVICQLIEWLRENNYNFIACSPTNKAAKNLANMASEAGIGLEVITLAKLLKQQAEVDPQTGKEEFVSKDDIDLNSYEVIIIDEFSMISEDNFLALVSELELTRQTKVIFVGDAAQLPPVGEDKSVVETNVDLYANLKTVVRYHGKLAKIAEKIRSDQVYDQKVYPFKTTLDLTIVCLDRWDWLVKATEFFKSDEFKANPNHVRFLVWRNKQADALNAFVREALWGKNAPAYVVDDKLIAKTPVFRSVTTYNKKGKEIEGWATVISASEECTVIEEGTLTRDRHYNFECHKVKVLTDDDLKLDLLILTEEGKHQQKEFLSGLKKQALNSFGKTRKAVWNSYYTCLKTFDNMPYAYAITTHKAQGSSINYCFVDSFDIRNCPDLQKILYTALTRGKNQVFIPE